MNPLVQTWLIVGLQLLFGTGLFVLLLRLTFVLGQYTQRVEHLEGSLGEMKTLLHELRQELTDLRVARGGQRRVVPIGS